MRVASLHVYPVKAVAGVALDVVSVTDRGLAGDRRWMLVDPDGRHITQREIGMLALIHCRWFEGGLSFSDGPTAREEDAVERVSVTIWTDQVVAHGAPREVSEWLSGRCGQEVRLVFMPDTTRRELNPSYAKGGGVVSFADGYPVLFTTPASLGAVNGRMDDPVAMRRFRPNVVVEGPEAFAEDRWRRIRVGECEFDIVKPCERCVVVDQNPATGTHAGGVLRALADFRRSNGKVYFGQNGVPRQLGQIRVGDKVEVLEEGEPHSLLSGISWD